MPGKILDLDDSVEAGEPVEVHADPPQLPGGYLPYSIDLDDVIVAQINVREVHQPSLSKSPHTRHLIVPEKQG